MRKICLVAVCTLFIISSAHAQLAKYNYNSDESDELNNHNPFAVFGTPDFSSGEYVALDSGEYIVLPNSLHQAFD